MKYINKDADMQQGHSITDNYLNVVCRIAASGGVYHYQNVDYSESFSSSGARAKMEQLALANQEGFCCYCMRDLRMQNQNVTLEHIVPQSASGVGFNKYTSLGVSWLTRADIVETRRFVGVNNIGVPPRPHTVTFENLVASCDGTFPDQSSCSQCCNNKRGNDFIYPMFYEATVSDEITYMEDGSMHPNNRCTHPAEYGETISHARLNCQNLMQIRRLWHLLKHTEYDVLISCLNNRDLRNKTMWSVLFRKADLAALDSQILGKFMNDEYWRSFLLYHWFHKKI